MNGIWRVAAALLVAAVSLACAGVAHADNSNNNTNNNDVTNIGDGSDTSTPTANENTSWPPLDVAWPPKNVMNAENGDTETKKPATPPIVMPLGQPSPTSAATPSTTETPTPIVPVASP